MGRLRAPYPTVNGVTSNLHIIYWRGLHAPALSTVNGIIPHLLSTEGSLMPPPLYLLWMVWYPYLLSPEGGLMPPPLILYLFSAEGRLMPPYIYCKWYGTPTCYLLKVAGCSRPYIYCKWYDTVPTVSWRWLDAPAPISTVNGLTRPTSFLLKVAWCLRPISTANGMIPIPVNSWRWLDAPGPISTVNGMIPQLLSPEGGLRPPLLYLPQMIWYPYLLTILNVAWCPALYLL